MNSKLENNKENSSTECNYCKKIYKIFNGSATNMKDHLKIRHYDKYN